MPETRIEVLETPKNTREVAQRALIEFEKMLKVLSESWIILKSPKQVWQEAKEVVKLLRGLNVFKQAWKGLERFLNISWEVK